MATYATTAEVGLEFKGMTFSASTAITDTQVDAWRLQAYSLINARVGKRYTTPLTATNALAIAKQIEIWLVAQRVQNAMPVKTGDNQGDQKGGNVNMGKVAMQMLDDIVAQKMDLDDATLRSSSESVQSFVENDTDGSDFDRTFARDTVQW